MNIETRLFGEIDITEDKIIHFTDGIIGFPDCKNFTLIYDDEKEDKSNISWLQSIDEPIFAMPVINPLLIKADYNPKVESELLNSLGELVPENTLILVTVTVPDNIEELSVNLKAPVIINADEKKACQIIVDEDLPVKYKIYDILQAKKAGE